MNPNRPQKPTGHGSGFHPRRLVADDGVNKQGAVNDVGLGVVDVTPVGVARRGPIFAIG